MCSGRDEGREAWDPAVCHTACSMLRSAIVPTVTRTTSTRPLGMTATIFAGRAPHAPRAAASALAPPPSSCVSASSRSSDDDVGCTGGRGRRRRRSPLPLPPPSDSSLCRNMFCAMRSVQHCLTECRAAECGGVTGPRLTRGHSRLGEVTARRLSAPVSSGPSSTLRMPVCSTDSHPNSRVVHTCRPACTRVKTCRQHSRAPETMRRSRIGGTLCPLLHAHDGAGRVHAPAAAAQQRQARRAPRRWVAPGRYCDCPHVILSNAV